MYSQFAPENIVEAGVDADWLHLSVHHWQSRVSPLTEHLVIPGARVNAL